MKEHSILPGADMVRALLAGRKTQMRVVVKPNPDTRGGFKNIINPDSPDYDNRPMLLCKYQPGDLLYVREAWSEFIEHHAYPDRYVYRADMKEGDDEECRQSYIKAGYPYQWRPSIHMPKAAARIWLQVESVREERLQDISEEDAVAEGVSPLFTREEIYKDGQYRAELDLKYMPYLNYLWNTKADNGSQSSSYNTAFGSFMSFWGSINGPESWAANPWVWRVSFKVLSTTGREAFAVEGEGK